MKFWIDTSVVALAFEKMRTPYASGRERCVLKFGNAYWRNRKTNGAFQFREMLKCFSQTMRVLLSKYSRAFRDRLPHVYFETCWEWIALFAYAVRIASMILRRARFLCVLFADICVKASPDTFKDDESHSGLIANPPAPSWHTLSPTLKESEFHVQTLRVKFRGLIACWLYESGWELNIAHQLSVSLGHHNVYWSSFSINFVVLIRWTDAQDRGLTLYYW